ncbi:hypothetical protein [Mameliella alba]|uniref:hypothetical protein n=1 Tax=Mameliella alba TaxID=561184 RepID=UPI0010565466|nr:hypothetical protein [Mameliella alba]
MARYAACQWCEMWCKISIARRQGRHASGETTLLPRTCAISILGEVAARRVVRNSHNINAVASPTLRNRGIENKAENIGLPNRKNRSPLSRFMPQAHKRMSKMLGYTLTLGTSDAWSGFSDVAAARLSTEERAALAFASLRSLAPDHAELTARAAIRAAGAPVPAFLGQMNEARSWAAFASRSELKAYAAAAYAALSPKDQAAFFRHISEVEIAA